jgi:hypothetical protein
VPERVVELAERALQAVGEHTGRPSGAIRYAGDEPAEVVLVASGARATQVEDLARVLSAGGLQAGALTLALVRPFPVKRVRDALAGARDVFVLELPGRRAGLLAGVHAAAAEKTAVHRLDPAPPAEMLEALEAHWPKRSFDASWRAEVPALPAHRLVLAPAGPWGEQLLCQIAAALGHLGSLRLGPRVRREVGALLLDWACDALPDGGADLLVVAAESFLDTRAALSLIHPGSAVLVVSAAEDSDELARAISADARASIREMDLRVSWVPDPHIADHRVETDGDPSFYLAGAALAALRERAAPSDLDAVAAELEETGRAQAARALRTGTEAIHIFDAAALDPARCVEEVDFRPAPALPRMLPQPEKTPDAEAWQRRIREFHRRGSGLAPTPWLPLQPAVLGSLGDALRERSLHPFALMRSEVAASPVAARALRELLGDAIRTLQTTGRKARALDDNLQRLLDLAAQALAEGELGVDLESLLAQAGGRLTDELALPEAGEKELIDDLAELRRRLPGEAQVLDLRPQTPLYVTLEVLDAARAPLRERFRAALQVLREKLHDLLDLDRMVSAEGRSADALAASLGGSPSQRLDPAALSRMLPKDPSSAALAAARRERIRSALAVIGEYLEHTFSVQQPILAYAFFENLEDEILLLQRAEFLDVFVSGHVM